MRRGNLFRTSSFRLTLLYAGLFAASVLVLFATIYWATAVYLQGELDSVVQTELATLKEHYEDTGNSLPALAAAIAERLSFPSNRSAYYLLQDGQGQHLAGNLPEPASLQPGAWSDVWLPGSAVGDDEPHRVRGITAALPDGGAALFVAQDYFQLDEVRELIARAFGWGAGVTLALALLGGVAMSGAVLRRIELVAATAEHIMAGDLGRRVPTRGTGDEFDRLAAVLNAMLARNQQLMEGLRQVSNDIAHDLRTPLTRLRQSLEKSRSSARDLREYEDAVDRAIAETDTILDTFGALLRIAQIEAGTRRAGFRRLDLSALLDTVLEVYGPAADEKDQHIAGDVPAGIAATGDPELLTQMIANLIENAIRHSPPGARIVVTLAAPEETGAGARIVVADSGPGIPVEHRDKVFRRFYRLDTSRTTPGSGLGLSLAAAIADLHGIELRLADNEPGLLVLLHMPPTASGERGSEIAEKSRI